MARREAELSRRVDARGRAASLLSRAAAAALAAGLAGCGRMREAEPNNHFTEATPLRLNAEVAGTMASAADVDVFRLEPGRDGVLDVHVGGIRELDFVLSVLDKDRRELKRFDETGVGGDEDALDLGLGRGVYYLSLSNKNPKAANPSQRYAMKLAFGPPEGRELEPNDKALTATPLKPGGIMRGHHYPSRNLLSEEPEQAEEDWFRVQVEEVGLYVLNADVSEVPRVDPVLEIYDVNSYKVKEADAGGPGEAEGLRGFGIRAPVSYFMRLRGKGAGGNPEVRYEILTELVPYRGETEFEPNDQRLDATPLERDEVKGTVSPAADRDWYKVSVAESTRAVLTAAVTGLAGMDLALEFCDEMGTPLLRMDNLGRDQAETLTGAGVAKGDYFLVVYEKTGKRADPRQSYVLSRTLTPWVPGLEFELNNSSASAQAVQVGESVDGYFAPKGDADWYEFNVYRKGRLVADLTGVFNVAATMTLLDQDYRETAAARARKPGDSLTLSVDLDRGTYALRLAPADPEQSNIRDKYTLRLRMQ